MGKKAVGVTVKLSGECDLVDEITSILEGTCSVLHKSRPRYHDDDDGCHLFIDVSGVNPID